MHDWSPRLTAEMDQAYAQFRDTHLTHLVTLTRRLAQQLNGDCAHAAMALDNALEDALDSPELSTVAAFALTEIVRFERDGATYEPLKECPCRGERTQGGAHE